MSTPTRVDNKALEKLKKILATFPAPVLRDVQQYISGLLKVKEGSPASRAKRSKSHDK